MTKIKNKSENATKAIVASSIPDAAQATLEQSAKSQEATASSEEPSKAKKEEKPTKPQIDPILQKKVNKHKSMFMNMLTHLKSKGFKCELITKELEGLTHPLHINGTHQNSKFIVQLHKDKMREDNGQAQVQLLLQVDKDDFIALEPFTNAQLVFMIEQYIPGVITIEQKEEVEESK